MRKPRLPVQPAANRCIRRSCLAMSSEAPVIAFAASAQESIALPASIRPWRKLAAHRQQICTRQAPEHRLTLDCHEAAYIVARRGAHAPVAQRQRQPSPSSFLATCCESAVPPSRAACISANAAELWRFRLVGDEDFAAADRGLARFLQEAAERALPAAFTPRCSANSRAATRGDGAHRACHADRNAVRRQAASSSTCRSGGTISPTISASIQTLCRGSWRGCGVTEFSGIRRGAWRWCATSALLRGSRRPARSLAEIQSAPARRRVSPLRLSPLASSGPSSSGSSSAGPSSADPSWPLPFSTSGMCSTETTRSSSAVSNTITPCVERPTMRMPSTGTRISWPPIGDEHDLVALLDREGADQPAVPLVDGHGDDAFAAASGDAVLVGRGALAVAVLRHREDELLVRAHLGVALAADSPPRCHFSSASMLRLASRRRRAAMLFAWRHRPRAPPALPRRGARIAMEMTWSLAFELDAAHAGRIRGP